MRNLKRKPIQIYIEPQQDRALAILSKRKGVSKAHLIREGIVRLLKDLPVEEDPAMGLIGLGSSGKGGLSENHDRYLAKHGRSKRN